MAKFLCVSDVINTPDLTEALDWGVAHEYRAHAREVAGAINKASTSPRAPKPTEFQPSALRLCRYPGCTTRLNSYHDDDIYCYQHTRALLPTHSESPHEMPLARSRQTPLEPLPFTWHPLTDGPTVSHAIVRVGNETMTVEEYDRRMSS
jgi:hypothetical protein